ncbi:hypothetical protein GE061_016555 [Apolygus lucorum]|uniref:Peptidase S1 domain-containing protein n=1 Tax=Apolygus lucorum TaxID=248454 RepID=A0A8S9XKJ7_APOLU|nr:hypothetical protein GE061_016555 [Apolygus lucorum]
MKLLIPSGILILTLTGSAVAVIGGEFSRDGEFPFAISLVLNGRPFCTGVLVDYEFVLSTCHCVGVFHLGAFAPLEPDHIQLAGGDPWISPMRSNTNSLQMRQCTQIIIHPNCTDEPWGWGYDYSLLRARIRFHLSSTLQPMELPYYNPESLYRVTDDYINSNLNNEGLKTLTRNPEVKNMKIAVISAFGKGSWVIYDLMLKYAIHRYKEGKNPKENWMRTGDERELRIQSPRAIMMSPELFIATTSTNEKVAVLLMVSQGILAAQEAAGSFALNSLASSCLLYHVMRRISEEQMKQIELFTEYAKHLQKTSEGQKPFQHLTFVVRGWDAPTEYEFRFQGGHRYLIESVFSNNKTDRVKTRQNVLSSFEKISCFLMADMVQHRGTTAVDKFMAAESLYAAHSKLLVETILEPNNLLLKSNEGEFLTVEKLFQMFFTWVKKLNHEKLPDVNAMYRPGLQANYLLVQKSAMKLYTTRMVELGCGNPVYKDPKTLASWNEEAKIIAISHFEEKCEYDSLIAEKYKAHLITSIDEKFREIQIDNDSKYGCYAVGWGEQLVVDRRINSRPSERLKASFVQLLSWPECLVELCSVGPKKVCESTDDKYRGKACAVGVGGSAACDLDDGGPVVCDGYLIALMSKGVDCGSSDTFDDSSLDRYIDAAVDRAVRAIDESAATVNHLTATTPDLFVNRVVDTPYWHTNATNDKDIGTPNRHTDTMMNTIIGTPTRHTIATPGMVVATPDVVVATPNTVVATPDRHTNTNVAMVVATPDMVVATPNEHTIATFDTLGVPDEVFIDPERIRPDTHGATTSTHHEEMTPETEREEFIEEYGWSTTAKTTTMIPPITSQKGNSSRTPQNEASTRLSSPSDTQRTADADHQFDRYAEQETQEGSTHLGNETLRDEIDRHDDRHDDRHTDRHSDRHTDRNESRHDEQQPRSPVEIPPSLLTTARESGLHPDVTIPVPANIAEPAATTEQPDRHFCRIGLFAISFSTPGTALHAY